MTPPLPAIMTPTLLASIRRHPNLPRHTWYFIAATALTVLNRPDEIPKVYRHAIDNTGPSEEEASPAAGAASGSPLTRDERLAISRRMREALVKTTAVGGLPKVINALLALKAETPPDLVDDPLGFSPSGRAVDLYDIPTSAVLHRGQVFWESIYGKVAKRVMGQMDRSGTEDLGLVARLMYGYLLSGTNILTQAETSFVLIAALIPQDVNPQLKGHLKGALNGGATVDEVRAVRDVVISICKASGMGRIPDDAPGGWGWRSEVAGL